ncbi:hypothetical protein [Dongshaea marina]|uniref:hypothetical protein n=1 Tax=Dongshaea marina TaxID=2047966 RepID=UPI000D3EAF8A|nr:hypothetical protein [Dongshaea marina]
MQDVMPENFIYDFNKDSLTIETHGLEAARNMIREGVNGFNKQHNMLVYSTEAGKSNIGNDRVGIALFMDTDEAPVGVELVDFPIYLEGSNEPLYLGDERVYRHDYSVVVFSVVDGARTYASVLGDVSYFDEGREVMPDGKPLYCSKERTGLSLFYAFTNDDDALRAVVFRNMHADLFG